MQHSDQDARTGLMNAINQIEQLAALEMRHQSTSRQNQLEAAFGALREHGHMLDLSIPAPDASYRPFKFLAQAHLAAFYLGQRERREIDGDEA